MPVRIGGAIDVRILPTPTLTLGRVEIGSAAQPQAKARELHAELALGSLMRGEFRASDVRLTGLEAGFRTDASGRFEWPLTRLGFDPDRFTTERVAIDESVITFFDAASGTHDAARRLLVQGRPAHAARAGERRGRLPLGRRTLRLPDRRQPRRRRRHEDQAWPRSGGSAAVDRSRWRACGWKTTLRASTAR